MEKPVENVEKCGDYMIFSISPQELPQWKYPLWGGITDKIMGLAAGYVAVFWFGCYGAILAKKLANLLNGGKSAGHW